MECDCLKRVNEKLIETHKDDEARLNTLFTFGDKVESRFFVTYEFRDKKRDGTFTRPKTGKLALSHCPFCGK